MFSDLCARALEVWKGIDIGLIDFLVITLLSTTALMVVKTIEELMGHYSKRFSIYEETSVMYGILWDIAVFYPCMAMANAAVIWIVPIISDMSGVPVVWIVIIGVWLLSLLGTHFDLVGCKRGKWRTGDYPIAMLYFNWMVDYWANFGVLFWLIGGDWVLYNVVMALTFIALCVFVLLFRKKGVDEGIRRAYSCEISSW